MARTVTFDRTVHGYTAEGHPIVRYERAGKWYVEPENGKRRHVKITEAAQLAVAGRPLLDRAGGQVFDARVRRIQGAT